MKKIQHKANTRFGIGMILALLIVPALIIGICTVANTQTSYAKEEAIQNGLNDFLATPLTEEEQALVASNADNATSIKLYGTATEQSSDGQIVGVKNLPVKFLGVAPNGGSLDKTEYTNEDGEYSITIPQFSKGVLFYVDEYASIENANYSSARWCIYIDIKDTISDFYYDFYVDYSLQDWRNFYAVVNHIDGLDQPQTSPAGILKSTAEVTGQGTQTFEDTKVPLVMNMYQSAALESNAIDSEYNTQIHVSGKTITYTFTINDIVYTETLEAEETNSDYVFDGWYKKSLLGTIDMAANEVNMQQQQYKNYFGYCKVNDGDYLWDFAPDSFSFVQPDESSADNAASSSTNGAFCLYIARFVPRTNAHNVTFKVTDETEFNHGYITGSNGNTIDSADDALKEFSFNVNTNNMFAYGYDNSIQKPAWYISDDKRVEAQLTKFELNWVGHNTSQSDGFYTDGFVFHPTPEAEYTFSSWKVLDKDGKDVTVPEDGILPIDQDLTFVASFVKTRTLTGTVTDNAGNPLAHASVSFRDSNGYRTEVQADAEGRFTMNVSALAGFLSAGKNEYTSETIEITEGTTTVDISLKTPENPVYLVGNLFRFAAGGGGNAQRLNAEASNSYRSISDVTINYSINDNENYTYYVTGLQDEENADPHYVSDFKMPIPEGSAGQLTFTHQGYQTMSFRLTSEMTQKTDPETLINVAKLSIPEADVDPGKLDPSYEPPAIVLASGSDLNVFISVDNTNSGNKISFTNEQEGTPELLDYTAGMHYRAGDKISVDFLSGTLTITTEGETEADTAKTIVTPVPNKEANYEFFGWVGYSSFGERIEFMSEDTLQTDLNIYAQFKKAAQLTPLALSDGHDSYTEEFYSNELKHVGEDKPIVVTKFQPDPLRQYAGTKYSVVKNQIKFEYDESWENPDIGDVYKEQTTLTANAKDGWTFDYWLVNGQRVDDTVTPIQISTDNLKLDVLAVYTSPDVPPTPVVDPTAGGTALTGDGIPAAVLALCVLFLAGAAIAARRQGIKFTK